MAADSKLIQEQKENHEGLIQYNVSYADVSQFSELVCWSQGFIWSSNSSRKNGSLSTFVITYTARGAAREGQGIESHADGASISAAPWATQSSALLQFGLE